MTLFCLTHEHGNGTDCYLFVAESAPDEIDAADQLGVAFAAGEDLIIGIVGSPDILSRIGNHVPRL